MAGVGGWITSWSVGVLMVDWDVSGVVAGVLMVAWDVSGVVAGRLRHVGEDESVVSDSSGRK